MINHRKQLFQDFVYIVVSIMIVLFAAKGGLITDIVGALDGYTILGIFVAGMFFTSAFTTIPAIAVLGGFSLYNDFYTVVLIGALGAVIGDYVMFRFMRDRVAEDVEYIIHVTHEERLLTIFKKRIFRWFVPFIGALIIASPFPDELGIAMLGLSKTKSNIFVVISYMFNALGILAIWIVARYAI